MLGDVQGSERIEHHVGEPVVLQSDSPLGGFGVVFEDDGQTGYLYGLDLSGGGEDAILDAVHVYDVRALGSCGSHSIEIRWAATTDRAGLFLGGTCYAVFDFGDRRAVCRTGFPPANGRFTKSHEWDDRLAADL